jgi:hypothetical protein
MQWQLHRDETIAEGLLQLAKAQEATCIVVGISGYSKKKLGSVSEELVTHATCNTIVIKVTDRNGGGVPPRKWAGTAQICIAGTNA